MKAMFVTVLLLSTTVWSQSFDCVSSTQRTHKEQDFHLLGNLTPDNGVESVSLSLVHQGKDREILQAEQEIVPDLNFHPRSSKLKNFDKFVLQKSGHDHFYLFLPVKISAQNFLAYVKFSYEGSYPDLEPMDCVLK